MREKSYSPEVWGLISIILFVIASAIFYIAAYTTCSPIAESWLPWSFGSILLLSVGTGFWAMHKGGIWLTTREAWKDIAVLLILVGVVLYGVMSIINETCAVNEAAQMMFKLPWLLMGIGGFVFCFLLLNYAFGQLLNKPTVFLFCLSLGCLAFILGCWFFLLKSAWFFFFIGTIFIFIMLVSGVYWLISRMRAKYEWK